jgi:hypothetical protein
LQALFVAIFAAMIAQLTTQGFPEKIAWNVNAGHIFIFRGQQ